MSEEKRNITDMFQFSLNETYLKIGLELEYGD